MELNILEKGQTLELDIVAKQGSGNFYFGAQWEGIKGADLDIDIVAIATTHGQLTHNSNIVYFGNKDNEHTDELGIFLSEDDLQGGDNNVNGSETDNEDVVIHTGAVPDSITGISVGLIAYSGGDLSAAGHFCFRVCDGTNDDSPEVAKVNTSVEPSKGHAILHAFDLVRTQGGTWELKNIGEFYSSAIGSEAIKNFAGKFLQQQKAS